jgi:geranylgeranyl pyrophosphate synthase
MPSDPAAVLDVDLSGGLAAVEARLADALESSLPLVKSSAAHLVSAGGKRFRPMLVLLCGRLGESEARSKELVDLAAAIEMTHVATLYHDDVMDESALRRGMPSANARFDNRVAILAGDWLFARASAIAADLGPSVSRVLADTIADLCEGQIMESEHRGTPTQTLERYLSVIERKTAALLGASCHLGAWVAGAPEAHVKAVTSYGRALGMAFQLSDDLLDVTGETAEAGKVPGTDLREGVWTLPVLATLAGEVPGAAELRPALGAGDTEGALETLRSNGSVDYASAAVAGWNRRAKEALRPVGSGPVKEALERLADFLGERTR